jgi:hypothetical protein
MQTVDVDARRLTKAGAVIQGSDISAIAAAGFFFFASLLWVAGDSRQP